jgi:protease II
VTPASSHDYDLAHRTALVKRQPVAGYDPAYGTESGQRRATARAPISLVYRRDPFLGPPTRSCAGYGAYEPRGPGALRRVSFSIAASPTRRHVRGGGELAVSGTTTAS